MPYFTRVPVPSGAGNVRELIPGDSAIPHGQSAPTSSPTMLIERAAAIVARESLSPGTRGTPLEASSAQDPLGLARNGGGVDQVERLRRQAHEVIEAFLHLISPRVSLDPAAQVPLVQATSVQPGAEARASVALANDDSEPAEATFYSTHLVSDFGYQIPSLHVSFAPRVLALPPNSEATLEVKIAVPMQTPRGSYAGLIRGTGLRQVKVVIAVEVQ